MYLKCLKIQPIQRIVRNQQQNCSLFDRSLLLGHCNGLGNCDKFRQQPMKIMNKS